MSSLPKSYINVAREITGLYPTYPPSFILTPGSVGRIVDGQFVKEGKLEQFKGYDPTAHAIEDEPYGSAVTVWKSKRVNMEVMNGEYGALSGSAKVKMQFGGANEALIICNNNSRKAFADLRAVKDLMRKLLSKNEWDREQYLVTEVITAASGWILFATEKGQSAEIEGATPLANATDAAAVLKAIAPNASVHSASTNKNSAGLFSALPPNGTPLFMAIRFKQQGLFRSNEDPIVYLKGDDKDFEEPPAYEPQS